MSTEITVRLDDERMRHLGFLRRAQGKTTSEIIRDLIDDAPWMIMTTVTRPA